MKSAAVVAVEAMEGTDAVIARAGPLAGAGVRIRGISRATSDTPPARAGTVGALHRSPHCRAAGRARRCRSTPARRYDSDGDAIIKAADDAGIAIVGRSARRD